MNGQRNYLRAPSFALFTLAIALAACGVRKTRGADVESGEEDTGDATMDPCASISTAEACAAMDLSAGSDDYTVNARCFWVQRWAFEPDVCSSPEPLPSRCVMQDGASAGCPAGCPGDPTSSYVFVADLDDGRKEALVGVADCWPLPGYLMCDDNAAIKGLESCDCACSVVHGDSN